MACDWREIEYWFLYVSHTDVFTSKYYIIQWISMNRNSTKHEAANELFAKG